MNGSEDAAPIEERLVAGSDRLYLLFGGIAAGVGMPPFEFYRASHILDASRIFLRDPHQAWYQRGLPGVATDAAGLTEHLRRCIERSGARRVCLVGNSMGGYAAILFAALLRRGHAVAFAPQTFIGPVNRLLQGDRRWPQRIRRTYLHTLARRHFYDLRPLLRAAGDRVSVHIHYCTTDPLDARHATRLSGLANVRIEDHASGGHDLVRRLRDDGRLPGLLDAAG